MRTSRAAFDRLLDPDYEAVTLSTLRKSASTGSCTLGVDRGDRAAAIYYLFSSAPLTVKIVRFLATILISLLLLSMNAPSVMACSTSTCCGTTCSKSALVNQFSCCKAPVAPDRAVNRGQDGRQFDSIASMRVAAVIVAISQLHNIVVAHRYSPPDRLASLALLCSRQI